MSKIKQPRIPVDILQSVVPGTDTTYKWKLVREGDGLTKYSEDITWLEWDEKGWFKAQHDYPAVGYALLMSPFNQFFAWQTTNITEMLELKTDFSYLKFRTRNSVYELIKL